MVSGGHCVLCVCACVHVRAWRCKQHRRARFSPCCVCRAQCSVLHVIMCVRSQRRKTWQTKQRTAREPPTAPHEHSTAPVLVLPVGSAVLAE